MTAKTRVRRGRGRDIRLIARAEQARERDPYSEDELRGMLADDEYLILVATQRAKYAGHIIVADTDDDLTITGLSYRSAEVGHKLIHSLIGYAKRHEIEIVRALPLDTETDKHLLYRSLGFRCIGICDYGIFTEYHFAKHVYHPHYFAGVWSRHLVN